MTRMESKIKENLQKETKPATVETGRQGPRHQGSEGHKPENSNPRGDGNYSRNNRTEPEALKKAPRNMMINIVNYNTVFIKHFVSLLKGNIPVSVKGTFEGGENFEYAHQQTCQELEPTVPDKTKREALVTLMEKNGCPLCVKIPTITKQCSHIFKVHNPTE